MVRRPRRKGRPISGWVILDKPKGLGSTEAVGRIKRLFNAEKAGHAGTLDPLASGMLPIALGEATKTVPYVVEGSKIYRFSVAWGEERNTDDLEGQVTNQSRQRPDSGQIRSILPQFIGCIAQTPPQFSAIKVDGQRAYDIARAGGEVSITSRPIFVKRLDLIKVDGSEGCALFEIECGKGTYVRALARDMGRALGCFGYIADLRRIEVAPFKESDFISLDELETIERGLNVDASGAIEPMHSFAQLDSQLIATGAALANLPHYRVDDEQAQRIRTGTSIILRGDHQDLSDGEEVCITQRGKLLAIGTLESAKFKPRRVFTV